MERNARLGAAIVCCVALVGCGPANPTPSPAPTSVSILPTEAPTASSGIAACRPDEMVLSSTGWGPAAGTTWALIHISHLHGAPCSLPGAPGVSITTAIGVTIASTLASSSSTELLSTAVDYRIGLSSWCGAPLADQQLTLRLSIPTGSLSVALPAGFAASCQGVGTSLVIEPAPEGTPPTTPPVTPPPSPPSISSPTPSTTPPGVLGGMPVVRIPPSGLLSAGAADGPTPQSGGHPTGPYVYGPGLSYRGLVVADVGGGSVRSVSIAQTATERIGPILSDGSWLVVMLWAHTGPRPMPGGVPCQGDEGQPIAWRILVARLGDDGLPSSAWRTLDRGVAARAFRPPRAGEYCDGPQVPELAVASGMVAYAIEAPTSANPEASRILVRSIGDGVIRRTAFVSEQVYPHLALSQVALAWETSANDLAASRRPDWRIWEASLLDAHAVAIDAGLSATATRWFAPPITLDGPALVAAIEDPNRAAMVRIDGAVRQTIIPPSANRRCEPAAADGGLAVLLCSGTAGGQWTAIWTASGGVRALDVGGSTGTYPVTLTREWLIVARWDPAQQTSFFVGVPRSALK